MKRAENSASRTPTPMSRLTALPQSVYIKREEDHKLQISRRQKISISNPKLNLNSGKRRSMREEKGARSKISETKVRTPSLSSIGLMKRKRTKATTPTTSLLLIIQWRTKKKKEPGRIISNILVRRKFEV